MKKNPKRKKGTETILDDQALRERIAGKAYELYQKRGPIHGHDLDDWLEAERLVRAELESQAGVPPAKSQGRVRRSKKG